MGFYGNIVTEPPQSFRYINVFNEDKKAGTLTAREVGATLSLKNTDGRLMLGTLNDSGLSIDLAKNFGQHYGLKQDPGEVLYNIYIDDKGDIEGGQGSLFEVDEYGLVTKYGEIDLQLPLAQANKAGLLSPEDKNRIDTLFEASTVLDTWTVVFRYRDPKDENAELETKIYTVEDGKALEEVPYSDVTEWYLSAQGSYSSTMLKSFPIRKDYIFYNIAGEVGVTYTAYFTHKNNGLMKALVLNNDITYTSMDIPVLEGEYHWVYNNETISLDNVVKLINQNVNENLFFIATDEINIALLTGIQVISDQNSAHSYDCTVINGATAILPAATEDRLGLVMISNETVSDPGYKYQVPSTSCLIERIKYATQLAIAPDGIDENGETLSAGRNGWLSASDKGILDSLGFETGTTVLYLVAVDKQGTVKETISSSVTTVNYTKIGKTYHIGCSGGFKIKDGLDVENLDSSWALAIQGLPVSNVINSSGFVSYLTTSTSDANYDELFSSFTQLVGAKGTTYAFIKQGYVDGKEIKYRKIHAVGDDDNIGIPKAFLSNKGTIYLAFNAFYNA